MCSGNCRATGFWKLATWARKGTHLRETRDAIQPYDARTHPVTVTALDGTQYTITQNAYSNANARSQRAGTGNRQLPVVRQRRLVALRFLASHGRAPVLAVASLPGCLHLVSRRSRRHLERQHGVQHGHQRSDQPAGFLRAVGFRPHPPAGCELRLGVAFLSKSQGVVGCTAGAMDAQRHHYLSIGHAVYDYRSAAGGSWILL